MGIPLPPRNDLQVSYRAACGALDFLSAEQVVRRNGGSKLDPSSALEHRSAVGGVRLSALDLAPQTGWFGIRAPGHHRVRSRSWEASMRSHSSRGSSLRTGPPAPGHHRVLTGGRGLCSGGASSPREGARTSSPQEGAQTSSELVGLVELVELVELMEPTQSWNSWSSCQPWTVGCSSLYIISCVLLTPCSCPACAGALGVRRGEVVTGRLACAGALGVRRGAVYVGARGRACGRARGL